MVILPDRLVDYFMKDDSDAIRKAKDKFLNALGLSNSLSSQTFGEVAGGMTAVNNLKEMYSVSGASSISYVTISREESGGTSPVTYIRNETAYKEVDRKGTPLEERKVAFKSCKRALHF